MPIFYSSKLVVPNGSVSYSLALPYWYILGFCFTLTSDAGKERLSICLFFLRKSFLFSITLICLMKITFLKSFSLTLYGLVQFCIQPGRDFFFWVQCETNICWLENLVLTKMKLQSFFRRWGGGGGATPFFVKWSISAWRTLSSYPQVFTETNKTFISQLTFH